jgi:Ca2+/Na+ antiporter
MRDVSVTALPQKRVNATCPRCKHVFVFEPVTDARQEQTAKIGVQQSPSEPESERISLKRGLDAKANKLLFTLFLLLILITVGVRLWADARYNAVPYPNLLAASDDGVAVTCGKTVYQFALDGALVHSYPFSGDVHPTQIFWEKGNVCLVDMNAKALMVFTPQGNEVKKFTGAATSAQFRVAREPVTGRLFVSDGANHRILVFDEAGRYVRSFGKEGNKPGEFRFPNELIFDETGQLLIANTKRPAIEVYTADGQYQSTLVTPSGDKTFQFPTDFVVTPDRLLLLENDGFLEKAKVRVYDRKGTKLSEMGLGDTKVIGDFVAHGERLYLTDCTGRQLLAFSLADLHSLGPFSRDFAEKCAIWNRDAKLFKLISLSALTVLLLLCAPVIFFYVRMKREELKEISQIDIKPLSNMKKGTGSALPSADLILAFPVNMANQRISFILIGVSMVLTTASMLIAKLALPLSLRLAMPLFGMIAMMVGILYMIRAGDILAFRRKKAEAAFKRIIRDGMLELLQDESVEKVALAQHGQSAQNMVLLIFTSRRLLLYYLSWDKVAKIEQCPFEAITNVKPPSGRMLEILQSMQVAIMDGGKSRELKYYFPKADFLRLLCKEFSERIGKVSGLPFAELCLTCRQPLQGEYCATCATKLTPDRQAMWLSLLFPGLGQLRNGELQKGLVFAVMTTILLLFGYVAIKGWFFEGADLSHKEKFQISVIVIMAPIWYVANIVDAYRSSIRGRKP